MNLAAFVTSGRAWRRICCDLRRVKENKPGILYSHDASVCKSSSQRLIYFFVATRIHIVAKIEGIKL